MDFAMTIYLLNLKAYYADRIILVNMTITCKYQYNIV